MLTMEKEVKKHKPTSIKAIILKRWNAIPNNNIFLAENFLSGCQTEQQHTMRTYVRRLQEMHRESEIHYVSLGKGKIRKTA